MHDNTVTFSGAAAIALSGVSAVLTPGQPYGGVTTVSSNTLDVKAGRKGSALPASTFNSGLSAGNMVAASLADQTPAALNFVVTGTLTLSDGVNAWVLNDARLGQGHYASVNNWWFGSSNCKELPSGGGLQCFDSNGKGSFAVTASNEDTFVVSAM